MSEVSRIYGGFLQLINPKHPTTPQKVVKVALCAILSFAAFLLLHREIAIIATAVIVVLTAASLRKPKIVLTKPNPNHPCYWFWQNPKPAEPLVKPCKWPFWDTQQAKVPVRTGQRTPPQTQPGFFSKLLWDNPTSPQPKFRGERAVNEPDESEKERQDKRIPVETGRKVYRG